MKEILTTIMIAIVALLCYILSILLLSIPYLLIMGFIYYIFFI